MNDLLPLATVSLVNFLSAHLPGLSDDWWTKQVVDRLSFQQQRMVQEHGLTSLERLDLAALLRILDQNWYDLSNALRLPRQGRTWIKEMQTVRNKWAHLSTQAMPDAEIYRDADTLGRLLAMIGAEAQALAQVQVAKAAAVAAMAGARAADTPLPHPEANAPAAPTSLFQIGDLVALRSNPSILMPIIEVVTGGAECRYRVFQDNKKATYYESQIQLPAVAEEEQTRLSAEALHAYLTSLQLLSPSTANLFSLRSGRVQFVPYQYRPVLKLIRADRPRLLIADEVGVGKTIEAGLIIKELRARMDISSVLIICPKALVAERKWFVEMRRFDEHFTALDGTQLRHCLQETHLEGEWPDQYAKAILPFSLFDSDLIFGSGGKGKRKNQGLLALDPPPKFDLVIVDEAHHIRNPATYLHQAVRYFCDNAQAAIFLTATPVQLGSQDLYTLLNALRPDLVIDHASFEQMAAPNRPINMAVAHCRAAKEGWQAEARTCLDEVAQTEWGRLFLRESPAFQGIYDRLGEGQMDDGARLGLTRAVEELYTFSLLINRTRRRDIGEFTTRKPETLTIAFTAGQQRLHDDLLDLVARILAYCHGQQNVKFMMTTIRRQAASCLYGLAPLLRNILAGKLDRLEAMEADDSDTEPDLGFVDQVRTDIEALLVHADDLDPQDPKVDAFVKVLRDKGQMPNNKALVFSTFRHTLAYLAAHTQRAGLRYGLIHGDVPDEERADLRRRFAQPQDDPTALDVLLSSEVGCEGLDFQFCDLLVNYDLPWNPMRIEQRIGRIDRYGQKSETVAVVNFITPGTVDADIYERCLWRIGVFQHAVGGSEEILGEITQELHDIAESFTLTPEQRTQRLQQLADNGIRQIQEEQTLESKQAELFGLTVPNQTWRQEIEAAETFWLSPTALQRCVTAYLADRLGRDTDLLLGEKPLKTLRLNQEARGRLHDDFKRRPRATDAVARQWEKWLKGAQPTLSVTFDQGAASENPNAVHLNVLHPLIWQAARHLEQPGPVHVHLAVQSNDVPAGEYPFALYRWQKCGVKSDQLLIAVSLEPVLEDALMRLLPTATDSQVTPLPDATQFDALDVCHHDKWSAAQANHIADNRELVEYRVQSLAISHRARVQLLEDRIAAATDDKIRLMRQGELARANADFERRLAELQQAAASGDIHATPVILGVLIIRERDCI
ncbi:helicase-related protein [uncultured Thiodictyon sp.]|jgi:superfamily II DNA or RNA helicase|uniref:DEAD/DEAH box helicase n=1 Tax=uncultured Thiodictyon sp. TaxID=1846217 RepID=UPI0025D8BA27|nr:helicase-related protein [uncultured Thiodictyon sp.]